jgi:hypothetical protein
MKYVTTVLAYILRFDCLVAVFAVVIAATASRMVARHVAAMVPTCKRMILAETRSLSSHQTCCIGFPKQSFVALGFRFKSVGYIDVTWASTC